MRKSIIGGFAIGLGAAFFLKSGNPIAFSLGILIIVSLNLSLITGYIPIACNEESIGFKSFLTILIGNILGAAAFGLVAQFAPFYIAIQASIMSIVAFKASLSAATLVLSGAITGALIGFGVIGFRRNMDLLGITILLFCITAFVVLGTEHIVANIFYLVAIGEFNLKIILCSLFGNILGGIITGKILD